MGVTRDMKDPETNREEQCLVQRSKGTRFLFADILKAVMRSHVGIFFLIIVEREADFHSTYRSSYSQ